ncbi:thiamine biosynthesis lipoprotein [Mycetocola sp. CAN_C7]|uniref:FAD:protein FMN transferase n=1 Tax=Mycetocola sp. CAN_C7 TaxID=2787724 RepID=UPI0018CB3727
MPAEPAGSAIGFEAIGTRWQIDSAAPISADLVAAIDARIGVFDQTWSRFREDSVVSAFARAAGSVDLGEDAPALFALYSRLGGATSGAVSPLVGDALERLGYDASYSLVPERGPRRGAPAWADIAVLDGTTLTTTVPVTIDIGAAGKGYLVDVVAALLTTAGHTTFTVDASGDIAHRGAPIRVALEHPYDPARAVGVVTLTEGSLCASATNRRTWGDGLHHVIDGRTGEPVDQVVATWALADDTATADGVATALFFAAPAALASEFGAEGVRIFSDGRIERSPGFPGELFR